MTTSNILLFRADCNLWLDIEEAPLIPGGDDSYGEQAEDAETDEHDCCAEDFERFGHGDDVGGEKGDCTDEGGDQK